MIFDCIFRSAKIVTPSGIIEGDIGIREGKIQAVGAVKGNAGHEEDLKGLFVLPGAIDMHVHFRDPGFSAKEDFATGSAAAAAGGVTTVVDMPNTDPPTVTCEALEQKRKIAEAKSHVNFGFYLGLTHDNLEEIKKAGKIAGVKVYMSGASGDLLIRDPSTVEALLQLGKLVIVHAEDETMIRRHKEKYRDGEDPSVHSLIRSPDAAFHAVREVLHLAKKYQARVHITHLSTAAEVEELRKFHGPAVSADCTPHHLLLTQSAYADRGNFVKVNPPLRTNKDRQALWEGLRQRTIDAVASDHAPHTKVEKEQPYAKAPAGVPGVETLLPVLLDAVNHGELSLEDVARLTAENPARILGIRAKGRIEAGYDADLVAVDMNEQREVGSRGYFTKCGWSPFSGWKLKGWPVLTLVGGQTAFADGKINPSCRGREIEV